MCPIERKLEKPDQAPIEVSLVPGHWRYGGIARDGEKVLASTARHGDGYAELERDMQQPVGATLLTDAKGRWVTPILPAGDGISINIAVSDDDLTEVDVPRAKREGPDLWTQMQATAALASSAKSESSKSTGGALAKGGSKPSTNATPGGLAIAATLLKVDESTATGTLTAMDGKQLSFKADSGVKQVPLADIQEITFKSSGSASADSSSSKSGLAAAQLELADGDAFKAAIKKWEEKKLTVQLAAASSVTMEVPVEHARQLWMGTSEQVKKAQALNEKPGVEDIAFVAKDDQVIAVRGIALGIEGDSLKFRFNDEVRQITVSRLVGMTFGRSEDAPVDRSFHQTVHLAGDDSISGTWKGLSRDSIEMTTLWGAAIKLPIKQVSKIRRQRPAGLRLRSQADTGRAGAVFRSHARISRG